MIHPPVITSGFHKLRTLRKPGSLIDFLHHCPSNAYAKQDFRAEPGKHSAPVSVRPVTGPEEHHNSPCLRHELDLSRWSPPHTRTGYLRAVEQGRGGPVRDPMLATLSWGREEHFRWPIATQHRTVRTGLCNDCHHGMKGDGIHTKHLHCLQKR